MVTASTYVKLQQAYAAEQNAIGGWTLIGYAAPGNGSTTNFNYTGAVTADGTATASTANAWKAASKVDLNDLRPLPLGLLLQLLVLVVQ